MVSDCTVSNWRVPAYLSVHVSAKDPLEDNKDYHPNEGSKDLTFSLEPSA
ncbi:hypothetical protein B0O80DRAFT_501397 [Mortierella sp. GBAus27b]|nr:hypothetical protein B0O80DRAFT_501397 [Mortierella sp. GBAus27b]